MNSLLFVCYQFSWISWVNVNHEIKYSTNEKLTTGLNADIAKWTNKISTKIQVSLHLQKFVTKKINESTVLHRIRWDGRNSTEDYTIKVIFKSTCAMPWIKHNSIYKLDFTITHYIIEIISVWSIEFWIKYVCMHI